MKKIIYIILLLSVIVFQSCDVDKVDDDFLNDVKTYSEFARTDLTLSVLEGKENSATVAVRVSKAVISSGLSVSVDEDSEAVEGVDFTLDQNFNFNGDMIEGYITLTGIFENAELDGKTLILNLTSSDEDVVVQGKTQLNVLLEKQCPIDSVDFGVNYEISVFAFGEEAPSHTVSLTPVAGAENQWTITSSWGPNFVAWATENPGFNGSYQYSGTLTLNDDLTVEFVGDAGWTAGGTGNFSACSNEFYITLSQSLFTNAFTVDIVMTGM